jgi:ATP-dependent DNA helicase RecG
MEPATQISLTTSIADVAGVGSRQAEAFGRLGVRSVADLIRHLPLRFERELAEQTSAAVARHADSEVNVAVRGELAAVRFARARKPRLEATLEDESGTLRLVWFNAPWLRERLHPGLAMRVSGRLTRRGGYLQMVNPRWSTVEPDVPATPREARLRPIYPATEQLTSQQIERAVDAVLSSVPPLLEDHLPDPFRERLGLPALADAYHAAHRPEDQDRAAAARRRLAFDELLLLELGVMLKRQHRRQTLEAIALAHSPAIDEHICARLPFTLTTDQQAVIADIAADVTRSIPMNRLLQGDVGAGKTAVALYAMLLAVASGHQAALMAPTELLAEQHHGSISQMLHGGRVRIELLTGSLPAAQRDAIVAAAESGDIDLLIGTHALLTEAVAFRSLAVAVIDEQHRFGVHQRATLRAKANDRTSCPHMLVMTATPIPRTLSLTIFGDLDVSTIRNPPPGRLPVITRHVTPTRRGRVYEYLRDRISSGDQAYIVVPVIDESDLGLTDVQSHLAWLREGPLRGATLEALHGRLARDEREAIMRRFSAAQVQGLVATTVIEVGIDVPGATIMVIEHAERFGLAQLHQLRGRVGRGGQQGLCVLVADPATPEATARLEAMTSTTDGFVIAEKDLLIRGPGELFGARQSGLAPFRVARLPQDLPLLRLARREAEAWVQRDPLLADPADALLRRRLLKAHGEALGLGDVA